jgi:hypothetical protein
MTIGGIDDESRWAGFSVDGADATTCTFALNGPFRDRAVVQEVG